MIILASNSKLRKIVMDSSGLPYTVAGADVDERGIEQSHADKTADEIVQILALAKAEAVAKEFPDAIVIAADTFGVLPDGTRIHKTNTNEESIQLAMKQSGQTVSVHTGTAVVYKGRGVTSLTTATITYVPFDEATVRRLFEHNANERRHGGLGFFIDAPGFTLVEKIDGSFMAMMGLPMDILRGHFAALGYDAM